MDVNFCRLADIGVSICKIPLKNIAYEFVPTSLIVWGAYDKFPDFFLWAFLLIVHIWNDSPLQSNLLRLQPTCTIPTTSGRPHGSPLVWACQWPSSQLLSSPQLSHNDSLWADFVFLFVFAFILLCWPVFEHFADFRNKFYNVYCIICAYKIIYLCIKFNTRKIKQYCVDTKWMNGNARFK